MMYLRWYSIKNVTKYQTFVKIRYAALPIIENVKNNDGEKVIKNNVTK